jgi:NhaA family Na+:H+ antiporter
MRDWTGRSGAVECREVWSANQVSPFAPEEAARPVPSSVRRFRADDVSSGVVLLAAALVALVWANSPWSGAYDALWKDLRHWVNDALMVVFFFVVGLEIKQELVQGRLRDARTAALPVVAALGGMVVPALLFTLVNRGGPGARGWGIPMATDIAFAVGVVAVLGRAVPASLKLFLLTLAVVDDIGAIVVIALFYASDLDVPFLLLAVAAVGAIVLVKRAGVVRVEPYLALGAALWLATYRSGVHATIAGVVLGLLTPTGRGAPAERIARALRPWTAFLVVPVFALANAGVHVHAGAFDAPGTTAVVAGVVLGLVAGKTIGIAGAAWLATRTGLARLPDDTTWPMMVATAAVAGIGFTVSLFVAELAFGPGQVQDAGRLGVLMASTLAAVLGGVALRQTSRTGYRAGH